MTAVGTDVELDVAAQVLDLVRGAAPGADAEVLVSRHDLALTRFANSFIHQNVADATTSVRLRLHRDGRTAAGSTTRLDGLRELVDRTVAAAALSPPDPAWPGVTPPTPVPAGGNFDEATAAATPAERAARVRAFVDATGGLTAAGYVQTARMAAAFANTAGQSLTGRATAVAADGIARTPTSDGVARHASVRLADLDGAVLGARAAAKARAGADPVELPPGRYQVVLEYGAVTDILRLVSTYGFNAKAVAERRSFAELGAAQFDPALNLVQDPAAAATIGLPFDTEGTPKRRLDLVTAGVTTALAHDRRTAARAGTRSTGDAFPGSRSWGPMPLGVALAPAAGGAPVTEVPGPAADSSVLALLAGVRRGLLVTDFWYTRILDPRPLVVTGLTRNGLWLVEHGEIVGPVRNMRFTQAYPQALAPGAVRGLGTHAVPQPPDWALDSFVTPALWLASWNFTGGASG